MSLRTFFLPTTKSDAGGVAGLGRVLHWGLTTLSLAIWAGLAWDIFVVGGLAEITSGFVLLAFAFAIVLWFIGRACRYVLAGE